MTGARADRPGGPTPAVSALATMQAIVQDGYGTRPEAVLRLAEIARPTSGDDEMATLGSSRWSSSPSQSIRTLGSLRRRRPT